MYLFDVLLKLIQAFHLVDSEQYKTLKMDVKSWEDTAVEGSEDKVKNFYAKLHKGVLARCCMPIVYFFALKNLTQIMNSSADAEDGLY